MNFLGEGWVLQSTSTSDDEVVTLAAEAVVRLMARGEWPATPPNRSALDVAADVDAMRRMTDEQKLLMPYAAHGNLYLHKLQLIGKEMREWTEPPGDG